MIIKKSVRGLRSQVQDYQNKLIFKVQRIKQTVA